MTSDSDSPSAFFIIDVMHEFEEKHLKRLSNIRYDLNKLEIIFFEIQQKKHMNDSREGII